MKKITAMLMAFIWILFCCPVTVLAVTDVVTEHADGSYAMAVEAEEIVEARLFVLDGSFVPVATFEPFN